MKVRATLDVVEATQYLGEYTATWAICRSALLCPECREEKNLQGCQKRFRDTIVCAPVDEFFDLTLRDGTIVQATDVEFWDGDGWESCLPTTCWSRHTVRC